jgi:hypothetical protein
VHSEIAKGQPEALPSPDAGKHRSTFCAFESSSSDTTVAVDDMWKGRQGLHEHKVVVDDSTGCSMKTANRGEAQCKRLPRNESDSEICRDINELPVVLKLKSDTRFDGTSNIVEFSSMKIGPTHKPATRRTPSSSTH